MKKVLLGYAGKAGGGYNHHRTQSNSTSFVQDDSKASAKKMEDKGQLVVFPRCGTYSKAVYNKLQEFNGSYSVVCEALDREDDWDMDFKNLRRLVAAWEGTSLFSKIMNARKDHRRDQTIVSRGKRIVVLS